MESKPLLGRRILVTRPKDLAGSLARLIEQAGGEPILFPAIEIEDVADCPALGRLAGYDMAIFVSRTAVQRARRSVKAWPATLAIAAIGSGTKRELEGQGVARVLAPEAGADSEALLAMLSDVRGKRMLIVRGEGGREALAETLRRRGAQVEYAECYRRVRPDADAAGLPALHAISVFSSEGLDNLLAMLGERAHGVPWFVPHRRVREHAANRGLREIVLAGTSDDEMVERLVAYFRVP